MPENIRRINNTPHEKAVTIVGLLDQIRHVILRDL
jgi:hypothetical protein